MTHHNTTVKFLENKKIDFLKWDGCILRSPQCKVYGLSWYLDIVSPGWSALVVVVDDEYVAAFPMPIKRKWGLKYLVQPFATQQLGFFYLTEQPGFIPFALNFIRQKFLKIDYNFNSLNAEILPHHPGLTFIERTNYCLRLNRPFDVLYQKFSGSHKVNIDRAKKKGLKVVDNDDFEILIRLFRTTRGKEIKEINEGHYTLLLALFNAAKSEGYHRSFVTVDKSGQVLAAAFFIIFRNKITYLMGASTQEGRKTNAMHLLLTEIILSFSETGYILDFEGGEIEGIGNFFRGFGTEPEKYTKLTYNRLKFLLK
jgi:hypothetical protein